MSLEEKVLHLTNAIIELANVITEQTKAVSQRVGDDPVSMIPAIPAAPAAAPAAPKSTIEDLRTFAAVIVKADQANGYDTCKEILKEFKVARFDELDHKDFDAAAKKFEAAIKLLKKGKSKKAPTLG